MYYRFPSPRSISKKKRCLEYSRILLSINLNFGCSSCAHHLRHLRRGKVSRCIRSYSQIWLCLKMLCTPLYPMVLLIIIPMKNGYFIGNINPTFSGPNPYSTTVCMILLLEHTSTSVVAAGAGKANKSSKLYLVKKKRLRHAETPKKNCQHKKKERCNDAMPQCRQRKCEDFMVDSTWPATRRKSIFCPVKEEPVRAFFRIQNISEYFHA